MGSERIGFFVIFLAVAKSRPHAVLFWRLCFFFFLYLCLFALLVSLFGHTSTEIIINEGCSLVLLLFFSGDIKA